MSEPLRWCAVCLGHYVRSALDYTCPTCEPQKPCKARSGQVLTERLKGAAA